MGKRFVGVRHAMRVVFLLHGVAAIENLQRLLAGLVADLAHGIVKNAFRHALLALPHHATDELRHQRAVVNRIGKNFASFSYSSSWHIVLSSNSLAISLLWSEMFIAR